MFSDFKHEAEQQFKRIAADLNLEKIVKQTEEEKAQNKYQPKNFVDFFKYVYRQPFRTIEDVNNTLKKSFEGQLKALEVSTGQYNRATSKQVDELTESVKQSFDQMDNFIKAENSKD